MDPLKLSHIAKALNGDGVNIHQPHHYEAGADGKRHRVSGQRAQLQQAYQAAQAARHAAGQTHGKKSLQYEQAKSAHVEAGRALAEHTSGTKPGGQLPLPQDHGRYFTHTPDTVHIPLDRISAIRQRPEGVANAEVAMRLAHDGEGGKRDPISLEHQGDGSYKVMDGNSTFAIANKHGWDTVPARIWEKGSWTDPKGEQHSPTPPHFDFGEHDSPQSMHRASGPAGTDFFTHEENSRPKVDRQQTGNLDELLDHAAEHKKHMDRVLDRGEGLDKHFGFHVVEGPLTHKDIEEGHRKGGLVQLAPLKGQGSSGPERLHQKVRDDYDGDYSRLRDISRATVAVSHPDDLPYVTHALRTAGVQYSAPPKDKMSQNSDLGYSDIGLSPTHKGHIGELQLNTLDMLQAKSLGLPGMEHLGSGHEHYEKIREKAGQLVMTPQEAAEARRHLEASQELYAEARRRTHERTPQLHVRAARSRGEGPGITEIAKSYVRAHYRRDKLHGAMSAVKNNPLRPGYFRSDDDELLRRQSENHRLEVYRKHKWVIHPNQAIVMHNAVRLSKKDAEAMAEKLGVTGSF